MDNEKSNHRKHGRSKHKFEENPISTKEPIKRLSKEELHESAERLFQEHKEAYGRLAEGNPGNEMIAVRLDLKSGKLTGFRDLEDLYQQLEDDEVIPIPWADCVISGEKKVVMHLAEVDGNEYKDDKSEESEVEERMKKGTPKGLEYYMSLDYKLELIQDETEGGYAALHPELKGCITCAQTLEKALIGLEDAKREWLAAAIEDGINIPEPIDDDGASESSAGPYDIQIDPKLYLQALLAAAKKGVSLNSFVEEAIRKRI